MMSNKTSTKIVINKKEWFLLILIFSFSLILRSVRLWSIDIWFDEVAILFQIEKTYAEIWDFCRTENFPPLYSWLLKIWSNISFNVVWLRFLNVILGSSIPLVAYIWGKELYNRKFGVLLSLACALSVPLIYYSQVIRMYSLFVLFACISYYGFNKALRTNEWKYWLLTAISNLLGFYTFLFMVFVIAGELLYLIIRYRFRLTLYGRPLSSHLPVFFIMLLWVIPLIERYSNLLEEIQVAHVAITNIIMFSLYLGTGTDFSNAYELAFFLNLPFIIGFVISVPFWLRKTQYSAFALIFYVSLLVVIGISVIGQRIFYNRYLIFLLPIYMAMVLMGWMKVTNKMIRLIGISIIFMSLLFSVAYYYGRYIEVHDDFRYLWYRIERKEGHSFLKVAERIESSITGDEIIIHYSNPKVRSFSYFPLLYYHGRSLPEYIYSKEDLPQNAGRQYLVDGDRIQTLYEFDPLPAGIWVVTLNTQKILVKPSDNDGALRQTWIQSENLPKELNESGYQPLDTLCIGGLTVVHFVRSKVKSEGL